jgi:hypothetical protein
MIGSVYVQGVSGGLGLWGLDFFNRLTDRRLQAFIVQNEVCCPWIHSFVPAVMDPRDDYSPVLAGRNPAEAMAWLDNLDYDLLYGRAVVTRAEVLAMRDAVGGRYGLEACTALAGLRRHLRHVDPCAKPKVYVVNLSGAPRPGDEAIK